MRFRPSRRLLAVGAAGYAVSLLLFSVAWVSGNLPSRQPGVELGFKADYEPNRRDQLITSVGPRSPAEKAGVLPGDRIVASTECHIPIRASKIGSGCSTVLEMRST